MKTELTAGGVLALTAVAGVGLFLYWNRDTIKAVAQSVNPASDQNLAYRAVNAATQAATGDSRISFGSWLYDITHPNQPDPTAPSVIAPRVDTWDRILANKARDTLHGYGFQEALGADGRRELVPPMTPATWVIIAGVSAAIYASNKRKRGSYRRRVRQ